MLAEIKYFLKHTATYSISNVLTKAAGFFLIPLYTNPSYLSAADFGLFGIIDISLTIFAEILTFGQGNSVLMFNNLKEFKDKKESSFFTITVFVAFAAAAFFLIFYSFIPLIASNFSQPKLYSVYLKWSGLIILLRIINNIFLSKLRADEKSTAYTITNGIKIILSLVLTIYFLVVLKLGIIGILYSFFISELLTLLIVSPNMIRDFFNSKDIKFDKKLALGALKFGFPLALASVGSMALNLSDRYVLKFFTDFRTVAIYDLGYRIAGVINMFIILPFSLTLLPIAYKISDNKGNKRYYIKLMTYLAFVLVWVGLAQSLFSEEFINFFTSSPLFKLSYPLVPIITFAYIFSGLRLVASLGLYFSKQTRYVAIAVILASVINIILNFIFIPIYGMEAAAYNTLFAFIFFHYFLQYKANKHFYIPFENWKILKAILVGILLFLIVYFLNFDNPWIKILAKIIVLCFYPFILYFLSFYEAEEIKNLKGIYKKWKNPAAWKKNFMNFFDPK